MRSFVIAAVVISAAATNSATTGPGQTGASRVALATVLDPKNHPVLDVGADDFVVQEAGTPREVLSVRPADYPIVIALDTGNDTRGDFTLIRKAAAHFIERIGQRPLALVTFGGTPSLVARFEDERETVTERLAAITGNANAASSLLEGLAVAAREIQRTGALFSSILVLSSSTVDGSQGSPDQMLASIVDSNAILHIVANRSVQAMAGGGFRPGATLRAIAEQSRGEFVAIFSAASFQSAVDALADRMSGELMIEYIVPVGSKPNDVKLGVRLVGARVRGLGVAPR